MPRATSSIRVNDNLILRPVTLEYLSDLIEAFEETWPEVSWAMPWIVPEKPLRQQIADFITETEEKGRKGILHHWVMMRSWDNFALGLIGFDRITRSGKAVWNLGYWVRSSEQQHGIARMSADAALGWIRERKPICIELKVDPQNVPGRSTVLRIVKEWNGERCIEGDTAITISGIRTVHECYLVEI
ncbi:MAG: GNAT family N-acetyltransferase [Candidatus Poseidoniales archaeon]|jgi:RimJ/RimL family protein N-acetyltransferase|tara:strand:+ start:2035 stop:2595 length:561 start_codon:yes stop_codon:yes gene_type:complete